MQKLMAAWSRFWFTPTDPATLSAIRIGTGLVLLYTYASCTPTILDHVGPNAWVDAQAIAQLQSGEAGGLGAGQSIWFYVQNPAAIVCLHAVFLLAIVGFTVGFWTRLMNAVVWIGHMSFIHRAVLGWSGMDTILAMLTLYLLLAPAGAAFSLDRWRQRGTPAPSSWSANLVVRLIQIHMCIIYLCAGLSKLQGARWWDGTAVWNVMMMHEFAPVDLSWLGHLGDGPCLLISNVGVLLTLAMEISFPFLIWNARVRPFLLALAVALHVGIGFMMGMATFGAVMLVGCAAFLPPESVCAFVSGCQQRLRALRHRTPAAEVPAQAPALPIRRAA